MKHKLKKGETFKVADSTPHYLEAIYDSSSCTIRAYLDGQKVDWDKVEDIDAGKGRFFLKMTDGTMITINGDDDDERNSKWPDDIRLYNKLDDIIWEYLY